jgi:hypothetical protein
MYLYKYLVPDRVDVLRNGMIRFTQAFGLNDPFELRPYFTELVPPEAVDDALSIEGVLNSGEVERIYEAQPPEFRSHTSLDAFRLTLKEGLQSEEGQRIIAENRAETLTASQKLVPEIQERIVNTIATQLGMLSLSANGNHALMWAHYAASHSGFVLEVDATHVFFNRRRNEHDELYHIRPVKYRPRNAVKALTDLGGVGVLACKLPEWEYEQEWRMLVLLDEADRRIGNGAEAVCLFRFPPEIITSVTLGLRASRGLERDLRAILSAYYPDASLRRIIEVGSETAVRDV